MSEIFLQILNMSITASWIALAVMLIRAIFKKLPKALTVFMWALVGLRLVFPFSFESVLSLIPSTETVPQDIIYSAKPALNSGLPVLDSAVNPVISENFTPDAGASVNPLQLAAYVASAVWVCGLAAMLVYAAVSYIRIRLRVREGMPVGGRVWICDRINTPFILGVFRPRIYLPSDIGNRDAEYVIAHENAHLARRDHLRKPIAFIILSVYWFNPVIWTAYILLCRDIELAADERVIKVMGTDIKRAYTDALINCSLPRRTIAACPLAFGETAVKGRVKNILKYKKPAFWIVAVSVAVCIVLSLCFLTNPKMEAAPDADPAPVYETPLSDFEYRNNYDGGMTITAYTGSDENVVIPSVIDGKKVTEIYEKAFYLNNNLKSVVIPDTVAAVCDSAFANCFKLESVKMSASIQVIEDFAFSNCKNLKSITLPEGLLSLGTEAFAHCFDLKTLNIPGSLVRWGNGAFLYSGLESVTFSEGLTEIGADCFRYTDLKAFTAPESLRRIGHNAFSNCEKLKTVRLNDSIQTVDFGAFYGCPAIDFFDAPPHIDISAMLG